MKKVFPVIVFLFCWTHVWADRSPVSGDSLGRELQVSLLTCSPGEEIYRYYGHSALLIRDNASGEATVYNYGLFDFGAPFFIWRFMLGHTDYLCGACPLSRFVASYSADGTSLREDVLNLTSAEALRLQEALQENILPQNAVYRYSFFYDNCATRIRDQVEHCIDGELEYPFSRKEVSLRDIVHHYSATHPWSLLGQDLLLGAEADVPADRKIQEFAPLVLEEDFCNAVIHASDGGRRPLVKSSVLLLPEVSIPQEASSLFNPWVVSLLLLAIVVLVTIWDFYRRRSCWMLDAFLLLVQGLIGVLITFMFFFSSHPTIGSNWLVLLFNPLPLVFWWYTVRKERAGCSCVYHTVARLWLFLFLCATYVIPQYISPEVKVLALCLLIRSMSHHAIFAYQLRKQ